MLPFTREQFFAVFVDYNIAIWPAQPAAYALAIVALAAMVRPGRQADRLIAAILAMMWTWTGIAYHWLFFAAVNKAALGFGALFVVEGVALVYAGVLRDRLRFRLEWGPAMWIGAVLVAYAAIFYPLLGLATGHGFEETPAFGVTPCPLTIFTFGMLLLSGRRVSPWLLVIPFMWSLVGGSAAILLGVPQDWLLAVSGIVAVPMIVARRQRRVEKAGVPQRAAWPSASRPPG